MMRSGPLPASPDEYVQSIDGWRRERVDLLRDIANRVGDSEETVKWGHLVYLANGSVAVIRAEEARVLFGLWRGKRLVGIEPALKPGGKYEMATIQMGEGTKISPAKVMRLIREARALNQTLGDPTADAPKRKSAVKRARPRPAGRKKSGPARK